MTDTGWRTVGDTAYRIETTLPLYLSFGEGRGAIGPGRSGEVIGIVFQADNGYDEPRPIGGVSGSDDDPPPRRTAHEVVVLFSNLESLEVLQHAVNRARAMFNEPPEATE